MEKLASETIYSGRTHIIPLCDVAFIERDLRPGYEGGIAVIMKSAKWNGESQVMEPCVHLTKQDAIDFTQVYCTFRSEIDPVKQGA